MSFWKSLKIQKAGFWKSFKVSIEHNSKNIFLKNPIFVVNNQLRRYCKMHTILFSKTNFKRIKLIKNNFSENLKNENSRVLEKFYLNAIMFYNLTYDSGKFYFFLQNVQNFSVYLLGECNPGLHL